MEGETAGGGARRWAIGLIAAGVGVVGYALFFRGGDEDAIRGRLDALAEAVRLRESETNPVVRGARIQGAFSEIFLPKIRVSIDELGAIGSDRRDLAGVAAQAGARYRSADLSFGSVAVTVAEARESAQVTATATLTGTAHDGDPRRDEREVTFELEKVDGDWRIATVRVAAAGETPE